MDFAETLLTWYEENGRDLPWRAEKDPYAIWISEVILQQTRIEQGLPYYFRFMEEFPDVRTLAAAPKEKVLRMWQGLGYYTRARNLHAAARQLTASYGGQLPGSSRELLKIRGIGPYTAAAIASIAFNEVVPAVDGNVMRVLARFFSIQKKKDTAKGRQAFEETARELIPMCCPGDFNQAMMDFGSTVCKPKKPLCPGCIFREHCLALKSGLVDQLPRKSTRKTPRKRYFHYFYVRLSNLSHTCFLIQQRNQNGIWQHMYEFPLLEADRHLPATELLGNAGFAQLLPGVNTRHLNPLPVALKHQLTHQSINAWFYFVDVENELSKKLRRLYHCTTPEDFDQMAKPRLIDRFFREHV